MSLKKQVIKIIGLEVTKQNKKIYFLFYFIVLSRFLNT